jgi:hypothetical protein
MLSPLLLDGIIKSNSSLISTMLIILLFLITNINTVLYIEPDIGKGQENNTCIGTLKPSTIASIFITFNIFQHARISKNSGFSPE